MGSLEEGNVRPSQLRECLAIAEILTTEYWEPNSSAVLILWDYFHRTIDQGMFLIQGEQLQNQWILRLVTHVATLFSVFFFFFYLI